MSSFSYITVPDNSLSGAEKQSNNLLETLAQGYTIISAVAGVNSVHYVLRKD